MKTATEDERQIYRQEKIKPLVDDFFIWVKKYDGKVVNTDVERSIRSFCVGKHSWHITASCKGAGASAILYSIAETTKANGLKPYEYFKYLLEQLLEHENETSSDKDRTDEKSVKKSLQQIC